ncbi:substrate-binding domain-containing protein [Streptomyces sp. 303MFCol5.2]|uniref:substrate-binding domain-containing protein n=1 Tax=Streptomyces sp. 303MFCol5.2 TaxID=1172181 RepID=UPI001F40A69A|nr:substrate-binding domain-containing protein [Streptomyces sp. 303MFCol5.2]
MPGGLTEAEGAEAAQVLAASHPRPTAVLAFNDRCATGVLVVFLRSGIPVPGAISVVGFDDSHLARLAHIDLTTVGQGIPRLAHLAVDRAIARLDGRDTGTGEQVVAPHLGPHREQPGVQAASARQSASWFILRICLSKTPAGARRRSPISSGSSRTRRRSSSPLWCGAWRTPAWLSRGLPTGWRAASGLFRP